ASADTRWSMVARRTGSGVQPRAPELRLIRSAARSHWLRSSAQYRSGSVLNRSQGGSAAASHAAIALKRTVGAARASSAPSTKPRRVIIVPGVSHHERSSENYNDPGEIEFLTATVLGIDRPCHTTGRRSLPSACGSLRETSGTQCDEAGRSRATARPPPTR